MVNDHFVLFFLVYRDSDAEINVYPFSDEKSSSGEDVSLEPWVEVVRVVLLKKHEIENHDVISGKNFRISGMSRIGSE